MLTIELPLHFLAVASRVADPHHFNADPGPAFYFIADPDPSAPHHGDAHLRPLIYRPFRASL
jgi:hypothetical protein